MPLTRDMIEALGDLCRSSAVGPSFREIASMWGRSLGATHGYLHDLHKRGIIEITPNRKRGIRFIGTEYLIAVRHPGADMTLENINTVKAPKGKIQ